MKSSARLRLFSSSSATWQQRFQIACSFTRCRAMACQSKPAQSKPSSPPTTPLAQHLKKHF